MSFILIVAGTALLSLGEFARSKRSSSGGTATAFLIPGIEIAGVLSIITGGVVLFAQIFG